MILVRRKDKEEETDIWTFHMYLFYSPSPYILKGTLTLLRSTCPMDPVDAPGWLQFSGISQTEPEPGSAGTCQQRHGPLE